VVQVGDEVEVMILEIDEERRRISLGMKQCLPNPWDDFSREFKKGDRVKGQIKSITDFGVFVGLAGGIDGLVHLSDLSWSLTGEEAVKNFKKGDESETWCCRSTSSATHRSASSSWKAIRSPASSPATGRTP
jgi:small subunit ribosomal protein S1